MDGGDATYQYHPIIMSPIPSQPNQILIFNVLVTCIYLLLIFLKNISGLFVNIFFYYFNKWVPCHSSHLYIGTTAVYKKKSGEILCSEKTIHFLGEVSTPLDFEI